MVGGGLYLQRQLKNGALDQALDELHREIARLDEEADQLRAELARVRDELAQLTKSAG